MALKPCSICRSRDCLQVRQIESYVRPNLISLVTKQVFPFHFPDLSRFSYILHVFPRNPSPDCTAVSFKINQGRQGHRPRNPRIRGTSSNITASLLQEQFRTPAAKPNWEKQALHGNRRQGAGQLATGQPVNQPLAGRRPRLQGRGSNRECFKPKTGPVNVVKNIMH